jgi:hypothetical protein
VPAAQDFNGFLKVLNPKLKASGYVLLLLYECGIQTLHSRNWKIGSNPRCGQNLRRTLRGLVDDDATVHDDGSKYFLTKLGIKEVEKRKPPSIKMKRVNDGPYYPGPRDDEILLSRPQHGPRSIDDERVGNVNQRSNSSL